MTSIELLRNIIFHHLKYKAYRIKQDHFEEWNYVVDPDLDSELVIGEGDGFCKILNFINRITKDKEIDEMEKIEKLKNILLTTLENDDFKLYRKENNHWDYDFDGGDYEMGKGNAFCLVMNLIEELTKEK